MGIVVEDGTGLANANSYASENALGDYSDDRAVKLASGDAEAALVRASAALDALFGSRYPGYRTNGRSQGLMWPRTEATDAEGEEIATDEIPQEIIAATCELAIRELTEAGSTMPDIEAGGLPKRIKAGSVEIEKFGNAGVTAAFQIVDGIMASLLGAASNSFTATSARG